MPYAETTPGAVYDPDFRYYALDRNTIKEDGSGGFMLAVPVQKIIKERTMHQDILDTAIRLASGTPEEQAAWRRLYFWSWMNWLPDYFFRAPASATHKYHPAWADRPDGLLLHSLAVSRIAAQLMDLFPDWTAGQKNCMQFAAWHHDMFKYGALEEYKDGDMTVHEHPVLAGDFFRLPAVRDIFMKFGFGHGEAEFVAGVISTHAGPYRNSRFSNLKLPECTGVPNLLLYRADYLASRKEDDVVKDVLAVIP